MYCIFSDDMVHSITNSNTFLAYFNHIDKFFEIVLGLQAYMPFVEKVDKISQGTYPITTFVRKYQHKLKYFGDLRNQVVHGFRLEQHHYLLASDYAIDQIKSIYEHLTKPPTIQSRCDREIAWGSDTMLIRDAIARLTQEQLSGLPIQNSQGGYVGTIFVADLMHHALEDGFLDMRIDTCLGTTFAQALFMSQETSVYEIEGLFSTRLDDEKYTQLVRVTATGQCTEPIIGIITPADLPKLDEGVIL